MPTDANIRPGHAVVGLKRFTLKDLTPEQQELEDLMDDSRLGE